MYINITEPTEFCMRTDWSQNSCIPEKKESWCRSFRLPTSTLHHNFYHVRKSSQENSSGQNQITHREKTSLSLSLSLLNSGSGIFNKKKPTHLPLEKFKYYFCHLYLRIGFLPQLYELHHWQRLVTVINKDSSRKGRKYSLEYWRILSANSQVNMAQFHLKKYHFAMK